MYNYLVELNFIYLSQSPKYGKITNLHKIIHAFDCRKIGRKGVHVVAKFNVIHL